MFSDWRFCLGNCFLVDSVSIYQLLYNRILALNNRMTNGELNKMWKEMEVISTDVLSRYFPPESEVPYINQSS